MDIIDMDEQAIIKASITTIFAENGFGDPERMTQRDFDHIGDQVQKKSGVLISGTTIKRLAFGEFSRLPQVATLNAIANYFDYRTWQEYKIHYGQNVVTKEPPVEIPKQPINKISKRKSILKYIPVVLIIFAGIYFLQSERNSVIDVSKASFSFRKNTLNDLPNSVVFNYNVDDVKADSFFIQQSWDANRRVRIYKNNYTVTDIYYEPGYHIAKLIANDSAIRTVDVSIPTDRWFFYAIDNVVNYTPEYIKTDSFANNGSLGMTTAQLQENNIDVSKDKRYHSVYFPTGMNVPADNFKFKTRVRMQEVRTTPCPYIEIELYCQRSFMIMRSTTKGCAYEALLVFGEQSNKGSNTDLLPIAFDVREWTDIEITVKNKTAVIQINGQEVFSTSYTIDTQKLAGLGYISNGLCEVDNVELTGLDGKIMYRNEF